MCKLERCRKATGSDTSLVDFDSVSFLVLQQHFICDHSGLAYLRRKHNVRIAMHTYICHRTQKIEKRKLCVRPTVRFDFSARKDNTILNTAHMNLVQETANEAMSFFQADQDELLPFNRSTAEHWAPLRHWSVALLLSRSASRLLTQGHSPDIIGEIVLTCIALVVWIFFMMLCSWLGFGG
ncbi:unnamed protein product, partial [Durusdinium trenchii]